MYMYTCVLLITFFPYDLKAKAETDGLKDSLTKSYSVFFFSSPPPPAPPTGDSLLL